MLIYNVLLLTLALWPGDLPFAHGLADQAESTSNAQCPPLVMVHQSFINYWFKMLEVVVKNGLIT